MDAKRGYVPDDERNFSPEAIEKLRKASRHVDHFGFDYSGSLQQLGKPDSRMYEAKRKTGTAGMVSDMKIAVMTFRLHAPWVHSLKEKRMIVKSLIAKLQNKYHVSAAEVDEQDTHQIIVIGVAAIVPHNAMADSLMEEISMFMEENTEAEIIDEEREIR